MRPDEYENHVANHFKELGYITSRTPNSNDYGVDVFASKGREKIAIQAKMFGGTSRPINRQMVMELHGAKDFFDCIKAIIATNGVIKPDAKDVADKLQIQILEIEAVESVGVSGDQNRNTFESIWQHYVLPLSGRTLKRTNGVENKIIKVDWSGVKRISSKGNEGFIEIEIFRKAINHLISSGEISRKFINEEYSKRAASGVILILSQIDFFQLENYPITLTYERK